MTELLTPREWELRLRVFVADPVGWTVGTDAKSFDEPIGREEFLERFWLSEVDIDVPNGGVMHLPNALARMELS